jgi:hypothetical protein
MVIEPKPLTPPTNMDPETHGDFLYDWRNYYEVASKQRKYNVTYNDHKDPMHPLYLNEQRHLYEQRYQMTSSSKDTANLEAVEDPKLIPSTTRDIPSHATSEAVPLDATAREDAPLATSHDTSLSPPQLEDAMPGGFD